MLEKAVNFTRYAVGGGGLYVGLSQLNSDLANGVAIVSLCAVGVVGVLSFVSHVLLHEQDAKAIGFSKNTPGFQFEVGFANLAFGLVALISYFSNWGLRVNTALILGYGLYLLQAGFLHLYNSKANKKVFKVNLIRAGVTFAYSGTMLYIVFKSIGSNLF